MSGCTCSRLDLFLVSNRTLRWVSFDGPDGLAFCRSVTVFLRGTETRRSLIAWERSPAGQQRVEDHARDLTDRQNYWALKAAFLKHKTERDLWPNGKRPFEDFLTSAEGFFVIASWVVPVKAHCRHALGCTHCHTSVCVSSSCAFCFLPASLCFEVRSYFCVCASSCPFGCHAVLQYSALHAIFIFPLFLHSPSVVPPRPVHKFVADLL